ncbi:MAG: hypothetical protein ACRDKS_18015 [Actinomycetota bacterium]
MAADPEALAAERLDSAIEAALGRGGERADVETDRVVRHLAVLFAAPVPADLERRVATRVRTASGRRLLLVRLLAAALGAALIGPALIQIFAGRRLSEFLGLRYEPHFYREYGLVLIVIGLALVAGAARPRWLTAGVTIGPPVVIALGLFAATEIPHAPNPGAEFLHFGQAALGIALLVAWFARRSE